MLRPAAPVSLAAGLLLLSACGGDSAPAAQAAARPAAAPVLVETLTLAPSSRDRELSAVGSLRAEESVTLAPEIGGRIARIAFDEGQTVTAGQLLVQLDDSIVAAELQQARANLALAERTAERAEQLSAGGLVPVQERDTARASLAVNQAAVQLAQAQLAKTRIVAPFAGVTGLREVSPGDFVSPGQALVNVEALSRMKLDFRVPELALAQLAVGQKLQVEVDALPGERFEGEVYALDPRVADDTRSIGVRARLQNPDGRLRPGLFARVRLAVTQAQPVLEIPEAAIIPSGDRLQVYVIDGDNRAQLRTLRVGERRNGQAEVLEGLQAGEQVVVSGLQRLSPGSAVTVRAARS
ncbi:MAG TPA: efflux RND transporter periplasmic adaptor subunit [Nevskiaceae bacterium]|nr:efflux RND transporter periplasmic adaptor subunit [Nevskiaceae bacterium]